MGAVYYKFRSAKGYDSVPVHGPFISVWNLKEKIFEAKHLGRGTDYDLSLANAQTNEDYTDEGMLVPRNTSVLVRRVPGAPRMRIVVEREEESKVEVSQSNSSVCVADSSDMGSLNPEELEGYDFGNDAFAIPEVVPVQSSILVQNYQSKAEEDRKVENDQSKAEEDRKVENDQSKAEEDRKIRVLVDMPTLDMQWKTKGTFSFGGGFGRVTGDRMMEGHGFGWGGSLERTTPPQGYICHRCKVPGHFIQHCPTNGNPSYDIRRLKHPSGIPKSMLVETPDGSFALSNGAVAIKPNEAAFVKEIEGLPLTRYVSTIPPELHCPLCKEVMKDAILTGKCCFRSFCDKCIRDHIISKSMCACGATNILADSLIPNKTLRETIDRVLESTSSTLESAGSLSQVQESNSRTLSSSMKEEHIPPSRKDGTSNGKRPVDEEKLTIDTSLQSLKRSKTATNIEKSEVTLEHISGKEPALLGGAPPLAKEKVQEKLPVGEPGKKKRKKACKPANAADLQWRTSQNHAALNHLMPFGPSSYNPYWASMQWGVNEYMVPYADDVQCMGYTAGPFGEGYM